MGDGHTKARFIAKNVPSPSNEQVQKMITSPNMYMRKIGVHHTKTEDDVLKALDHHNAGGMHHSVLSLPHIGQRTIDKVFDQAGESTDVLGQAKIINHPKNGNAAEHFSRLSPEHQHHIAKSIYAEEFPTKVVEHIYKNNIVSNDAIQSMHNTPEHIRHEILDKEGIGGYPDIAYRYSKSKEIKDKIVNLSRGTTKENLVDQAVLFHHDSDTNHILNALKNPNVSNSVKRFGEDTLLKRGHYDKELGISESLDSKEVKTELPHDSMLHQMGLMSASMVGGSNFSMHQIGNSGYLVQFDKDGATEVHHLDENLSGGRLKGSMTPSMKMVGTFKDHIQNLLDSGKKVRVSTHKELGDGFRKITERLITRHPEYKMSAPQDAEHELTGDKLTTWELSK